MRSALASMVDRWLGRGEAAITVPPMDGPLKPNRLLDEAEVVASFAEPEDLAWDGEALWVADGPRLLRVNTAGMCVEHEVYSGPITALAATGGGIVAVVGGSELVAVVTEEWRTGPREIAGAQLRGVNALSACADGSLLATVGSTQHEAWARDLMTLGRTGRLLRLTPDGQGDAELASGLAHAFGALELGGRAWVSESWAHRVLQFPFAQGGTSHPVLDRLPAYPSRLAPAANGGAWLTLFAARTRLVEFVLREHEYRRRMVAELEPQHWVAPALSSGHSFLEPLQGGAVKQLGIAKPWAPPRSYGLVVRLNEQGLPVHSLHSRADGRNHGIVSAAEAHGWLYVLAKGPGKLLRLKLDALESGGAP